MILKIAWRNIWRNKIRSFTVMGSVIVGVWALIFFLAFTAGFIDSYINGAIENEISHLQLHNPDFKEEKEVQYTLKNVEKISQEIAANPSVAVYTTRSLNNGMLATAKGSRGVQIRGVLPQQEAALTKLDQKIVEGKYFEKSKKKNPIIVSKRLAKKLKLRLKSKVVLTFQEANGELTSAAFKIIGLYETGNAIFEEVNVFVQQKDLSRLLGSEEMIHEVALMLHDIDQLDSTKSILAANFPEALVENYKEISPDVNLYESQMSVSTYVITVIVMLALIFGIINTMLMAVLERSKELGVLMAVGMKRWQLFMMIIIETLCLGLIAAPIGLLLGYLTVTYYGAVGIDLSAYSEGMDKFGLSDRVYTTLDLASFVTVTVSVAITAILAALYPALKATRLNPVEAMRKI
ncbi:ABC transporter permease [Aureispira anguillae]|uniref:FtsX-like permease family protein n=1 Tax=Aureispira anguillae TaxID=2864201 RepID=A0A916DVK6_9BACT|nr:FtsX-like permease family protein [Aureispira anguillae]BDS13827.1 FtsX-like permease family protein [Aureispira anguillae]